MPSILIHDKRLAGTPPGDLAERIYEVDDKVAIQHAISWIGHYARQRKHLTNLYVMCHGYEADWDLQNQMCTGQEHGGFGLCLCKEGLTLSNVSVTSSLKGLITRIVIFACATADTAPYNIGTAADGRRLCADNAQYTGAQVIAAVQTQYYTTNKKGVIDFGMWEGPVLSFSPDSQGARPISADVCWAD